MGAEQSLLSETVGQGMRNSVNFLINGKEYNVSTDDPKIGPDYLLIDYIRDNAGLMGTKYMCREGGCGACVVTARTRNPNTGEDIFRSINSCLLPIFSCDGFDITTIEGIGSTKSALHPIQQRMVNFSGTQCGYCTPGWIMNMYGFMQSKKADKLFAQDIEDCMDGNICRCTGYRPILDAMKSFAVDASEELRRKCGGEGKSCDGCPCLAKKLDAISIREKCEEEEEIGEEFDICSEPTALHLNFNTGGYQWVKAVDLSTLFLAIHRFVAGGLRYRVVGGNTGTGVFKDDGPYQAYVELNSIPALRKVDVNPGHVILGGAVTISEAIEWMKKAGQMPDYGYCKQINKHWKRVAGTPVRNLATLAGNLMLKHSHPEFPSDIFLILETIGAMLTIASAPTLQQMMTIQEFLNLDMTGKIIMWIHFPKLSGIYFRTFKITRRYQNSHAYVNAGFIMRVDPRTRFTVRDKPSIVFGGIAPNFVRAVKTELFLIGKFLDIPTIQGAMTILDSELIPNLNPTDADPMYRKSLAQSLLYKFILGIISETLTPKIKSGWMDIEHGLTYAKQTYDTDKEQWPLNQPIPKLEAPIQCTGEAEYVNDIHPQMGELHAAFVLTKVGNAILAQMDASEALKMAGVIGFVTAKDIPGKNNYMSYATTDKPDLIFVEDKIQYAGQPVGVIVAESRDIAIKATKLVRLSYSNVEKPILGFPAAFEHAKTEENKTPADLLVKVVKSEKPPPSLEDAPHSITGEFRVGTQFHFTIEPQTSLCIPREDGMDVHMATQWMDHAHVAISECLAMPSNAINMHIRRLGGGYGAKLARAAHVVTACAIAAHKMNSPVRMVLDIESNMCAIGKRNPFLYKYSVGFEDSGKILSLDAQLYSDGGCTSNEATVFISGFFFQNCYNTDGWKMSQGPVKTNTAPNTFCRAPGSSQSIACIEYIMEHIAFTLKKDPMEVRLVNLLQKGDAILVAPGKTLEEDTRIPELHGEIRMSADLDDRKKFVETFNQNNRWKKRGLAVSCMCHPIPYLFSGYSIFMAVYASDGTVALSHCGIEMGQGINTKVAQVVARQLKIPLDKIKIKPVNSLTGANSMGTATSVTSERVCWAALKACEILLARLEPVRAKLENPSWEVLVAAAHKAELDLTVTYNSTAHDALQSYNVWSIAAAEVEIDVLTGEYKLIRMDIINDAGQSISPEVDVGQVEGSIVMGIGLWLTEKIVMDQTTGEVLTNRTWNYKPPAAKDIPEDFRVTLLKNSKNPYGVLGSKAAGEAPFCLSISVFIAVKHAITAARADVGNMDWFPMGGPISPEDIHRLCLTSPSQFTT